MGVPWDWFVAVIAVLFVQDADVLSRRDSSSKARKKPANKS